MAYLMRPLRLLLLTIVIFLLFHGFLASENRAGLKDRSQATLATIKEFAYGTGNEISRVSNRTLGFERVYAIGLPERSDKRDALSLMAALSGFDVDWIDGVKPSSIHAKAVPYGIDTAALTDNFLGSWRGHMDAVRTIVASGIISALVMEDDDVHIKQQLQGIAQGTRQVTQDNLRNPHSPYGDNWDLLWLGHCGEPFPETLEENVKVNATEKAFISSKYEIEGDITVPPYHHVSNLVDWSNFNPGTRVVHKSAAPICSFAYALSQTGARKVLHALSVDGLNMAFDNSLAQLCRDAAFDLARGRKGGYGLRCVSVNPTMLFHHKAKGRLAGDSDIQSYGGDGSAREKGMTESIMWSMRLNLMNLLSGERLEAQFED